MLHFMLPKFTPRTLEELHTEPDEVSSLVYMEDAIAKELTTIRDYNKNATPLGELPPQDEEQSEPDDDRGAVSPESEMMSDDQDSGDNDSEPELGDELQPLII